MKTRIHLFLLWVFCLGSAGLAAAVPPTESSSTRYAVDIPAQALGDALQAFALVCRHKLLYSSDLVSGKTSPALKGQFTTEEGVRRLLANSGLNYEVTNNGLVMIRAASAGDPPTDSLRNSAGDRSGKEGKSDSSDGFRVAQTGQGAAGPQVDQGSQEPKKKAELEEIVVTGTHIRGAEASSAITTLSQEDILLSGQTNLGQAVQSLPQSFSGGQNPGVGLGANSNPINTNLTSGSSVNLRGLGPDATLTLLNGRRLPYDGINQAVDISSIPLAALDRLQILLDGASAIYGSDAVAGVANVILKRDYDGLTLTSAYGTATDAGDSQVQFSGVGGKRWDSGGFLLAGNFQRNSGVYPNERDFASYMPNDNTLYPPITQKNVLLTGHQVLTDWASISMDALYAERSTTLLADYGFASTVNTAVDTKTYWISPTINFALPAQWTTTVNGSFSRDTARPTSLASVGGVPYSDVTGCYCNRESSAEIDAEGPIIGLNSGDIRASLGGGYRATRLNYDTRDLIQVGQNQNFDGSRSEYFAFGELAIPFVSADQQIPGVSRLSANAALRYDHYNDFGGVLKPKAGIVWALTSQFSLKGSWGKSFKAPTLYQEVPPVQAILFPASIFGVSTPASGTILFTNGGNPNLRPEEATTYTISATYNPEWAEHLHIETGYFHIDYTNRVITPFGANPLGALNEPALAPFIQPMPTLAQQQSAISQAAPGQFLLGGVSSYVPADVLDIVYNQNVNFAHQVTDGIDLSGNYSTAFLGGTLAVQVYASWMEGWEQLAVTSPRFPTVGTVYNPPHFRSRDSLSWTRAGLTIAWYVNYIGGLQDNRSNPYVPLGSQTTIDSVVDYKTTATSTLRNLEFNLSVMNLLNRRPPFLQPIPNVYPNYDSTNYSAIGRFVNLSVTKHW